MYIIYNYNESVTFSTDPEMEMQTDRQTHRCSYSTIKYTIHCVAYLFLKCSTLFISLLFSLVLPFGFVSYILHISFLGKSRMHRRVVSIAIRLHAVAGLFIAIYYRYAFS